MLKISIITVCYNAAHTLPDTIRSVAEQDYPEIEHIIVDGGSTDGTVNIIEKSLSVTRFVSEPDKGIYDAMNKGIAMATGNVIGTLNADDFYATPSAIDTVAKSFLDTQIDACFADLVYVDTKDTSQIIRYWKSNPFQPGAFKLGWMPAASIKNMVYLIYVISLLQICSYYSDY